MIVIFVNFTLNLCYVNDIYYCRVFFFRIKRKQIDIMSVIFLIKSHNSLCMDIENMYIHTIETEFLLICTPKEIDLNVDFFYNKIKSVNIEKKHNDRKQILKNLTKKNV